MGTSYIVGMRSNSNVTFDCKYHVVWCPKYRRDVLVRGVDVRLKQIVCEVARERGAKVMELEVMPDHVHLLVDVDPLVRHSPTGQADQGQARACCVKSSSSAARAFRPFGPTPISWRRWAAHRSRS